MAQVEGTREDGSLVAVVPPEHGWLRELRALLVAEDLPVREMVLNGPRLRVELDVPGEAGLRVEVAAAGAGARAWRVVGGLAVSHAGRAPSPGARARLERFGAVLARFAPRWPRRLRGFAAIVRAGGPPASLLPRLFPFVTVERSRAGAGGAERVEVLVRTLGLCNEACPFCAAPMDDRPSEELVRACLDAVARLLPGAMVSLTGGEPTLKSTFLPELRHALALREIAHVQVQTNATELAARLDPAQIPPDPRLSFFASLHAVDDALYDACTGSAGLRGRAVAGIRRLLDAGHAVTVNTVVTRLNVGHLGAIADALAAWPVRPTWHLSALMCPDHRPAVGDLLVPYGALVPALEGAAARARAAGLEVESLLSSTHASVPACLLPDAHRAGAHLPLLGGAPGEGPGGAWAKAPGCRSCADDPCCPGVPARYAERFGLDELRPRAHRELTHGP